jgi:hypothetical protein
MTGMTSVLLARRRSADYIINARGVNARESAEVRTISRRPAALAAQT